MLARPQRSREAPIAAQSRHLAMAAAALLLAGPARAADGPCDRACLSDVADGYLAASYRAVIERRLGGGFGSIGWRLSRCVEQDGLWLLQERTFYVDMPKALPWAASAG